ncbi:MAG: DUF4430 domain-containing protein [Clostridia bacterium]|nr:DUF4430 domain-containing protein [Clostridia bacterium]
MKKLLIPLLLALTLTGCGETDANYHTDPIPEGRPQPVEPQDAVIEDAEYTCTFSIVCDVLVDCEELDKDKRELVPEDGVIFAPAEVTFYGGESVFNLLRRVCRQNAIHLEFEETPLYNSAYIEGIANLYEFDAGATSGWLYTVNGWSPNYGCSRYALSAGDEVVFVYTLDIGDGNGFLTEEAED